MNRQKILTFIFIIALAIAGIYYYRLYGAKIIPVANLVIENNNSAPVGEDILQLVQRLDYINIDNSIFASALFTSLKDYSVQIVPGERARPNPFAPLAGYGSVLTPTPTPTVSAKLPIKR